MIWLALAKFLSYSGLALLLGGAVMRRLGISRPPLGWLGLGAALLLLGAGLEVGSTLAALGFTEVADVADFLTSTRSGQAAVLRLIGAALLLAAEIQSGAGRGWRWLGLGGAGLLVWGLARAGHAGQMGGAWTVLDALHAAAAAIWVGGVLALALAVFRREALPPEVTARFTRVALACLGVLLLSGAAATLRHVPLSSLWPALCGSTWGLALLIKLGLIALALAAAMLVRRALAARRFAPLWLEGTLLLGVLGASGALSTQPPPTVAEVQRQAVAITVTLGGQTLSGQLVLSGPGDAALSLSPALPGLSARLVMLDHPMPAQGLDLRAKGGEWRGQTRLWMSGNWVLELSRGGESVRLPFGY